MKTFLAESCQPIYEGGGPPRIVVGNIFDGEGELVAGGKAEIHMVEHEDEDFIDLMKAATQQRILRAALGRVEQRRRKTVGNSAEGGIIKRRGKSPQ